VDRALAETEAVVADRPATELLDVWLEVPSSAWVSCCRAVARVLSDELALVVLVLVSAVADAVLVLAPVDDDEALTSCSEVRKARASVANLSAGPPEGGGGGGPVSGEALWVLVDRLFCPL